MLFEMEKRGNTVGNISNSGYVMQWMIGCIIATGVMTIGFIKSIQMEQRGKN